MKTRHLLSLPLFSIFFVITTLPAQWTEIPYIPGTYIYDDLEFYKGATFTPFNFNEQLLLFKTEDNIHWELVTEQPGIVPFGLSRFVLGGENMYLFGFNLPQQTAIAYRSSDGGNQWTSMQLPAPGLFLIAAQDSSIICASKTDVFQSADNGDTWSHVLELPEIPFDLKPITSNEWLITTAGPIFYSAGGTTWDSLPAPYDANGIDFPQLTIYPTPNAVFIEFSEIVLSKLYRSTDNMATWECFDIPASSSSSNIWDIESVGDDLYAVMNSRIALSQDNGATWDYVLSPQGTIQLATNGDTLLAGGSYGFFKSYDLADTWRSGNQGWEELGLPITDYIHSEYLYRHKEEFHLSTSVGHYFTDNNGIEWQLVDENRHLFYGAESGDSLAFLGVGVLRNLDGGTDWEFLINDDFTPSHKFTQVGPSLFSYKWLESGFLRSDDWGATWSTHWDNALTLDGIASDGSSLYFIENESVLISNDKGQTFSDLNNGLGNPPNVKEIWGMAGRAFLESNNQLWRLEGNVWQPATNGLLNIFGDLPIIESISGEGDLVFISAKDPVFFEPSFFLSTDGGKTWEGGWESGLPNLIQFQAFLKNGLIHVWGHASSFAGTSKHIWIRELDIVNIDHTEELANHVYLFPNPTDGSVELIIQSGSPFSGTVQVHTLQGQLLWSTTLYKENRINLPSDQSISGTYIVSATSLSGWTTHHKLIVQKP